MGLSLDKIKKFKSFNPYPEELFLPLTKEEVEKANDILMRELGFGIDRIAGHIGRKIWNITMDWLYRLESGKEED